MRFLSMLLESNRHLVGDGVCYLHFPVLLSSTTENFLVGNVGGVKLGAQVTFIVHLASEIQPLTTRADSRAH